MVVNEPTTAPLRPESAAHGAIAATHPSETSSQATLPEFPTPARLDARQVTTGLSRSSTSLRSQPGNIKNDTAHSDAHRGRSQQLKGASVPLPTSTAATLSEPPVSKPAQPLRFRPFGGKLSSLYNGVHASLAVHRDVRTYLPPILNRFLGYREPGTKAPFDPLPFPPFTWLRYLDLKHEVWLLATLGAFVGIALIEIVMATAFAGSPDGVGMVLIVASFGASAVLVYGALDAPLSQPRNLVGGQVLCAIVGVAITRLFRKAGAYELHDTTQIGDLGHVVWLNGALAMAIALLVMLMTDTVHPPAGATALIAAVQPAVVHMSWHYIYIVLISSLLMLGWGLIINNVGRRRYPAYWISGKRVYVQDPSENSKGKTTTQNELLLAAEEGRNNGEALMASALARSASRSTVRLGARGRSTSFTQNEVMMAALEGRNDGFDLMTRALSRSSDDNAPLRDTSPASSRDWEEKNGGTGHHDKHT